MNSTLTRRQAYAKFGYLFDFSAVKLCVGEEKRFIAYALQFGTQL